MSEENVDRVRASLDHFLATGGIYEDTFDEEVVIRDHDVPERAEYRGRDGFFQWMQDWSEPWAEWAFEPEEYIDAGNDRVVVFIVKATGRSSGAEVSRRDAIVYGMREGRIVSIDYYNEKRLALEAAGRRPSD